MVHRRGPFRKPNALIPTKHPVPHEEKEPIEWRSFHVGTDRGVNYEHMQVLVTNIFQRQWEWQEDRRTDLQPGLYRYNTAFMVSLDMKDGIRRGQAFSGIEDTHLDRRTLTAALLTEMQDVRGPRAWVLKVSSPRSRGGSGVVGTRGQI